MNTEALIEATNAIPHPEVAADFPPYREQVDALESSWREWLHNKYASDLSEAGARVLYVRAENDADFTDDYRKVEEVYSDLADFIFNVNHAV